RSCIEDLPEECRRKVQGDSLQPDCDKLTSRIFEQYGCRQTHKRAHPCDRYCRDDKNKMEWVLFFRIYDTKCRSLCDMSYKKEIKYKSDRRHNHKFMKC